MGVDCCIFAKKAKRYYYFDRGYNITRGYWASKGNGERYVLSDAEHKEADDIYYKLINDKSATMPEVLILMTANLKGYNDPCMADDNRSGWIENIMEFVLTFPHDEYMVISDHEEPPSWGYQAGNYHDKYHKDLPVHEDWEPVVPDERHDT